MARKYAAKKLTVRLSQQEWEIVQQISESEGIDYNDVIRDAVRRLKRGLKSPSDLSP